MVFGALLYVYLQPLTQTWWLEPQLILLQPEGQKSETHLKVKALAGLVPSGGSKERIPFPTFFRF